MQLFKPGPYEEFVGKLSSISVRPENDTWDAISRRLDKDDMHRKRLAFKRFSVAAGIILLIGLSLGPLLIVENMTLSEELTIISNSNVSPYNIYKEYPVIETEEIVLSDALKTARVPIQPTTIDEPIRNSDFNTREPISEVSCLPFVLPNRKTDNQPQHLRLNSKQISQSNTTDMRKPAKNSTASKGDWSVVAFVNPSYSSHTSAALDFNQQPIETGTWMWGGEVLVKRKINRYLSVYSGILVSPIGQEMNNLLLLRSSSKYSDMTKLEANTSLGNVSLKNSQVGVSNFSTLTSASEKVLGSSSIDKANLRQRFYFMEIPLMVSAGFRKGALNIEVKIGCAAGVLIDNKFEVRSNGSEFIGSTDDVRRYNTSALGSINFSFPVNNQVSLMVEPSLRLNLRPLSYSHAATYPFTASVKFGMGYRF